MYYNTSIIYIKCLKGNIFMKIKRTSIELNEQLLKKAITLSQIKTQRGTIELALEEFVAKRTKKNLNDIKGTIEFADDYDYKAVRKNKGDKFL